MATNLVSLAMKFLTPDMVMKMASALGLDKALAQKAVGAAVPAILAGLVSKVGKPDGAKAVKDLVAKQEPGVLSSIAGMIGGSSQSTLVSAGTSALNSLLGGTAVSGLAGALAKYANVGDAPAKSLLGMIGPVVMGAIGQEQRANKLDTNSLTSLLTSQKENIGAAMPADFAKLLGGTGLLDAVQGHLKSPAPVAPLATPRKVETPSRTVATPVTPTGRTQPAPSTPWWYLPVFAAAALGLGWSLFGTTPPTSLTTPPGPAAQRLVVDGVDVSGQMTSVVDSARAVLGSIRDAGTAQAAVPKLNDVSAQIDRVAALAAKMTPETRKSLAGIVASGNAGLAPLFSSVLALPGVSAAAKPAIDAMRAKLDVLAKG